MHKPSQPPRRPPVYQKSVQAVVVAAAAAPERTQLHTMALDILQVTMTLLLSQRVPMAVYDVQHLVARRLPHSQPMVPALPALLDGQSRVPTGPMRNHTPSLRPHRPPLPVPWATSLPMRG